MGGLWIGLILTVASCNIWDTPPIWTWQQVSLPTWETMVTLFRHVVMYFRSALCLSHITANCLKVDCSLFTTNNCYCFTPTLTILKRRMMRWVTLCVFQGGKMFIGKSVTWVDWNTRIFQGEAAKPVNSWWWSNVWIWRNLLVSSPGTSFVFW